MKFEETVLTADGVVQLILNIIIDKSMTISMLKNQGTNKNNQRKKKITQAANTHTHTNTGSRGKTEHSQLTFPTLPEKHDSKERVTPE
jgi:hypothetical protein